jgi:hypothetical protein
VAWEAAGASGKSKSSKLGAEYGFVGEILVLLVGFVGLELVGGMLGVEVDAAREAFAEDYFGSFDRSYRFLLRNGHFHQ